MSYILGIAIERLWMGDVVVIDHGRVRRATKEELKNNPTLADGINDIEYKIQDAVPGEKPLEPLIHKGTHEEYEKIWNAAGNSK